MIEGGRDAEGRKAGRCTRWGDNEAEECGWGKKEEEQLSKEGEEIKEDRMCSFVHCVL